MFCYSNTVWKLKNFSVSHFLREISFQNFRLFRTAILLPFSDFEKIDFTKNVGDRKFFKFSHCATSAKGGIKVLQNLLFFCEISFKNFSFEPS